MIKKDNPRTTPITIHVDTDMAEEIQHRADMEKRTVSTYLYLYLQEMFEDERTHNKRAA